MSGDWLDHLDQLPSVFGLSAAFAEDLSAAASNLDGNVNALLTAFNAFDNSCITADSIVWRLGAGQTVPLMHEHLFFFGPFGVVFAGIYLGLEVYDRHRKRDTLNAHWYREKKQLAELYEKLKTYLKKTDKLSRVDNPALNNGVDTTSSNNSKMPDSDLTSLAENDNVKYKQEMALILNAYQKKLRAWQTIYEKKKKVEKKKTVESENRKKKYWEMLSDFIEKNKLKKNQEMLDNLAKVQKQLNALEALCRQDQELRELLTKAENDKSSLNIPEKQAEESISPLVEEAKAKKNAIAAKLENSFLTRFSSTFWFQVPFAWSWGYWFVFFFSCWGWSEVSLVVPLEWGLLALIGPVLYLAYREYCAYQSLLVADESQLTEEQQTLLIDIKDDHDRLIKRTEMLEANKDNTLQFRWGWVFVALIAAVSAALFCGFAPFYAVLLGISVFLVVGVGIFGITEVIKDRLAAKRDELKEQTKDFYNEITLKVVKESKDFNVKNSGPGKSILLVGEGMDKTAYFVDQGKFVLDEKTGLPRTANIKLAAFLSSTELKMLNDNEDNAKLQYRVKKLVNSGFLSQISIKQHAFNNRQKLKEAKFIVEYKLQRLADLKKRMEKDAGMIFAAQSQANPKISKEAVLEKLENAYKEAKTTNLPKKTLEDLKDQNVAKRILDRTVTNPRLEQYRKYLVAFVGFVGGYTLGCIVGFASTDLLGHIDILNLSWVISEGMITHILVGAFSLIVAVSHMKRKGLEDEKHLAELQEKRANPAYLQKHDELEKLEAEINRLKVTINTNAQEIKAKLYSKDQRTAEEYQNSINKLINKPPKEWTTDRIKKKALFIARAVFKVLTDVSSVILMARALLTMGFSRAILPILFASSTVVTTSLKTGLFSMFGAVFVANPLGITVLTIAVVLLVAKGVLELYMLAQKEKELAKIDKIDSVLKKKSGECEDLSRMNNFMNHVLNPQFLFNIQTNPKESVGGPGLKLSGQGQWQKYELFYSSDDDTDLAGDKTAGAVAGSNSLSGNASFGQASQ